VYVVVGIIAGVPFGMRLGTFVIERRIGVEWAAENKRPRHQAGATHNSDSTAEY
jgi:hypothetical protein